MFGYTVNSEESMPRKKKEKPIRVFDFNYFVLNVKLYSSTRSGDDAYRQLFADCYAKRIRGKVSRDRMAILRSVTTDAAGRFMWGTICQFLSITDKDWVNLKTMQIEEQEIPLDKFPGSRESDFIFFPAVHRFAVRKNGVVSLSVAKAFLEDALAQVLGDGETVEVIVEQSADVFERILKAKEIRSLDIEITPSNGDIYDDYKAAMDEEVHLVAAGKVHVELRSRDGGKLHPENSRVFGGMIAVAQSNGNVRAVITNDDDRRETIETSRHPETFPARAPKGRYDVERESLFQKLLGRFRSDATKNDGTSG